MAEDIVEVRYMEGKVELNRLYALPPGMEALALVQKHFFEWHDKNRTAPLQCVSVQMRILFDATVEP